MPHATGMRTRCACARAYVGPLGAQELLEESYRDKLEVEDVCRGFLEVAKVTRAGAWWRGH